MQQARISAAPGVEITRVLAEHSMRLEFETLPEDVVETAKHCLLDWLGVTIAGAEEPLTRILTDLAMEEGGAPHATLIGDGRRTSLVQAALVNGSASHALDYDDVQANLRGHPSVPVLPAVLALAEKEKAAGPLFLTAFVAGVEAECRIGAYMGDSHYENGWHATGTVGTFGAAAGAGRVMGLDAATCATAFGIAATQAAGLKAMFGTMCKPLHAGKAAANGLLAAQLAARGFTSRDDALERPQGFAATELGEGDTEAALDGLGEEFEVRRVLFKYHAACYGTHAAIEAARRLRASHDIDLEAVERVEVAVAPRYMNVCGIAEPRTGLEGKFSLRFTTALALAGEPTGLIATYSDEKVNDPALVALYEKVSVVPRKGVGKSSAEVAVHLQGGLVLREYASVAEPAADRAEQWQRLIEKFHGLAAPVIGNERSEAIVATVATIEEAKDVTTLMALAQPPDATA